jgi:hypothetical protein
VPKPRAEAKGNFYRVSGALVAVHSFDMDGYLGIAVIVALWIALPTAPGLILLITLWFAYHA